MATYGYEELNIVTDSNGNVLYGQTQTPPTTPTTTPTPGGPKWWESVIGIVPALTTAIAGIFGQNQQQTVPVYYPGATTTNNNNLILIGGLAVVVILFFSMQKRR